MTARRPMQGSRIDARNSRQMTLGIETMAQHPSLPQRVPRRREKSHGRLVSADPILWMRDIVVLTGKHRCTIHRWIQEGVFPKKDAPKDRPRGWLQSTYERWLLGNGEHAARR
jgi:predicted DNA-binding transcriptional regulator AlpA